MAQTSTSNTAVADDEFGLTDAPKPKPTAGKSTVVDPEFGLVTAPAAAAPQQAGDPNGKTEQERTGFHTAANIPPMAPQTETQFEKERNAPKLGVWGGIKSMLPGIFEAPQEEDKGKDFATKMLNAEARHGGTDPRTLESTRPTGPSNEWTTGETLRHGYDAGAILPGGKAPVIGPIIRGGEAAAYGLGTAAGVDPQKEEEFANKADAGAILGSSAVPIAAAVAGETAGNANEIKKGVRGAIDKVAPGPAVAPGLSDIATDNLKTGKDTRVGNERLFRGADPSGGSAAFRESLATALPDLKQIELENPIGKSGTKGGIVNPDFRLRQTVANIDNHLDGLWNEQRSPQIEKWKDSNTTARNDLGLNEDQLQAIERRMGEKIPDHIPLGEADALLKKVNAFTHRAEAMTPEGRALALEISPTLESFDTMKKSLHDRIGKTLEAKGEPGVKEFNRRYAALSDVRDQFRKGMNPAESARLLDNIKIFGSPTGHSITDRIHIKASPGRNVQKGLERLAKSDLPTHPDFKQPPSIIPPTESERALAGRPTLPQVGGPESLFGHDVPAGTEQSLWDRANPVPDRGRTAGPIGAVDMWDPNRLQRWAGEEPHNVQSPEYTAHLREQEAARQPGGPPPKVGDVGRVEATRPQPVPAESSTILPDRSGTATKGLLPENREVPSTTPPPVPSEFRSEYVGPTDFNERSRLGPKGDQGVRGPILMHDPQPGPTTQPRTPAGRPALAGPIGSVENVPRGTNGPNEIFGADRNAELAAVEPELAAREQRRQDITREATRGAADAFESQPQSKVPEIKPAKETGDVGSIADREGTAGAKTEFRHGENLVGAAHNSVILRDASGREIGNALLTDSAENGKRGMRVSVSQIEEGNRGKGFGKKMYNDIIDHAKEQGLDYVESDKKRTPDADRVWESLKREGKPVRLENGRYILDIKDAKPAPKTGTANDRPQVAYKPSEKAETMSGERKDLGKQFDQGELTHEVERNQAILDNPKATDEEKESANKFFEQHPDRKLNKTDTRTAAERNAARGSNGKVGHIGKVTEKPSATSFRAGTEDQNWKVDRKGEQLFAVEPGPNGVENRVSFKEGEKPEAIRKRLDDQAEMRKKFFADRAAEKNEQNKKDVDSF